MKKSRLNTDSEIAAMRKEWITQLDRILNDECGSSEMKNNFFEKQFKAAVDNYWSNVNETWGENGGGDGRLELCGETGALGKPKSRMKSAGGY